VTLAILLHPVHIAEQESSKRFSVFFCTHLQILLERTSLFKVACNKLRPGHSSVAINASDVRASPSHSASRGVDHSCQDTSLDDAEEVEAVLEESEDDEGDVDEEIGEAEMIADSDGESVDDEDDEGGGDQEGDDESDCDSQGENYLKNPSQNIRVYFTCGKLLYRDSSILQDDMEKALKLCAGFQGTFSWAETNQNSPNPCLNITGIGDVGIPLSERDAQALIELCRQLEASSGEGEKCTPTETSVQNIWELSPSAVSSHWDRL
jgi:hypothetical protein